MAYFLGIEAGQDIRVDGLRILRPAAPDKIYMAGKWLDLGEDHAVLVYRGKAIFFRQDKSRLCIGEFPAWVARGRDRPMTIAAMFNIAQFRGGGVEANGHVYRF